MNNDQVWHEDDGFWQILDPFLFTRERLQSTPLEVDNIIALLDLRPGMKILDLCCGIGRHTLEIARRGYDTVGVDRTQFYLDTAQKGAKQKNIKVEFIKSDMREYVKPDTFDVILNLFSSFGYFEDPKDDEKVLKNAFQSLKKGGVLLIETMSREIMARIFRKNEWNEIDGVFMLQEHEITDNWTRVRNRWIVIDDQKKYEYCFSHRIYSGSELVTMLEFFGFKNVDAYSDYAGNPYNHQLNRLVIKGVK
ncbi:MAG: class I SAM-dependent methyltransferase [Oligoflexia bacterium]|nr:class I SAM-dependent methyltransferase [Oligoflexia bacterium]